MARGKGFAAIVGRKKGSVWGTPVVPAALGGFEVSSFEAPGNLALVDDNMITGTGQPSMKLAGNTSVPVTVKGLLRYEGGWLYALAQLMGTAGAPSTVDTTGKQHKLKFNSAVDAVFDTLVAEIVKDTTVLEIPSCKWTKFTLRGRSGQPIEFELSGFGDAYNFGTSATNTTTTVDSITYSVNNEIALFKHAKVLMNAQTGADFTDTLAGDQLPVTGFEITIERPMEPVFSTARPGLSTEPRDNGWFMVTGSFDYPDLETAAGKNAAYIAPQLAGTPQKAKIILTGATLCGSATQYFQLVFWLPYVQLGDGKPGITGPEGLTWSQSWESKAVGTIPTGFTAGYTDSVTIDAFNKITTDLLA